MAVWQQHFGTARAADNDVDDLDLGLLRVLVVDRDEIATARLVGDMRPLNHAVSPVLTPEDATAWLDTRTADLVVFFADNRELALRGTELLTAATRRPLIVVGPSAAAENRVAAFDHGAQDYMTRPVEPQDLDRRVRVLVKRDRKQSQADELAGPQGLLLNVRSHEAFVGALRVPLTPKEFAILQVLLERRGEVVVPDQIAMEVWGHETFGSRNFVEAHISRLRGKLSRAGAVGPIRTVRAIGYVIR